jgi:hypothetical protein
MSDIIQFAPPDEQEPGEALALKMVALINAEESSVTSTHGSYRKRTRQVR